ncbi:3-ketoacyl-CoA synthase [Orobanche gracilis]
MWISGGCAVILTNDPSLKNKAILKLNSLVRIHQGARDESYDCCIQKEDEKGFVGFHLGKNLPKAATQAFVDNLQVIAPKILPVVEIVRFAASLVVRKVRQKWSKAAAEEESVGSAAIPIRFTSRMITKYRINYLFFG